MWLAFGVLTSVKQAIYNTTNAPTIDIDVKNLVFDEESNRTVIIMPFGRTSVLSAGSLRNRRALRVHKRR